MRMHEGIESTTDAQLYGQVKKSPSPGHKQGAEEPAVTECHKERETISPQTLKRF